MNTGKMNLCNLNRCCALILALVLGVFINCAHAACVDETSSGEAVKCLEQKISALQARLSDALEKWKSPTYKVIAAVRVEKGSIVSSTPGVSYNKRTGVVVFPNSRNKSFIPVVTDFKNYNYSTETHYLREITGADRFRVWRTALDTTDRNDPPESFTAIVIGF